MAIVEILACSTPVQFKQGFDLVYLGTIIIEILVSFLLKTEMETKVLPSVVGWTGFS